MRISDWSSDECSSDLRRRGRRWSTSSGRRTWSRYSDRCAWFPTSYLPPARSSTCLFVYRVGRGNCHDRASLSKGNWRPPEQAPGRVGGLSAAIRGGGGLHVQRPAARTCSNTSGSSASSPSARAEPDKEAILQ